MAKFKPRKKYDYDKQYMNRKKWLNKHPEDNVIDEENMRSRLIGWDNDGVRGLMAAVCLHTVIDYKRATLGKIVDDHYPEAVMDQCEAFFQDDIFQHFVNGMKLEEIKERIGKMTLREVRSIYGMCQVNSQKIQGLL